MEQTVEVAPPGAGPYLLIATYLPLTHWRHLFQFFKLSSQIQQEMRKTPGVIRFSVRAKVLRKQFWTCSVWKMPGAEDRVESFVYSGNHNGAVNAFAHWDNKGQSFVRWTSDSTEIRWPDVLKRLEAAGS
jgi:hypothetical protein